MSVVSVEKDYDNLSLTLIAEFDAAIERVWQLWADPRQLERWWGPPSYPATFTAHDFRVGGRSEYHMTGPEGPTPVGYWQILELDRPRSIRIEDGFVQDDARNDLPGPGEMLVTIEDAGNGQTRMLIENIFRDAAAMEQLLAMGMEQGLTEAVGQIDAILAEAAVA